MKKALKFFLKAFTYKKYRNKDKVSFFFIPSRGMLEACVFIGAGRQSLAVREYYFVPCGIYRETCSGGFCLLGALFNSLQISNTQWGVFFVDGNRNVWCLSWNSVTHISACVRAWVKFQLRSILFLWFRVRRLHVSLEIMISKYF